MSSEPACRMLRRSGPRKGRLALLALLVALPLRLPAQERVPRRPRLARDADTNSAVAYYQFGMQRVDAGRPDVAAEAFYWAARLAPDWADPLYARWVALVLSHRDRLVRYMEGDRSVTETPEGRALDSLRLRALELDPFVYEDLGRDLVMQYLTEVTMAELRQQYRASDVERARQALKNQVELRLQLPAAASWRAWLAYSDRRFDDAAKYYAQALGKVREGEHRELSWLHAQRGRVFYLAGYKDSAQVELRQAIDELRITDTSVTVPVYESKAMLEHSLGVALEGAGDAEGARAAYGRALVEDLGFYPPHVRLAGLLAIAGDTAGAESEYQLALEVAPGAAVPRALLASLQYAGGDVQGAVTTLEPLLRDEPYWPEPYLLRGVALQGLADTAGAVSQYTKFLQLAQATDNRRAVVLQRLVALRPR